MCLAIVYQISNCFGPVGRLEHIPLLMQIVRSGGDEGKIICGIPRDHAQITIDAINKAPFAIFNHWKIEN